MYQEAGVAVTFYELEQLDIDNAQITIAPGGLFKKVMGQLLDVE